MSQVVASDHLIAGDSYNSSSPEEFMLEMLGRRRAAAALGAIAVLLVVAIKVGSAQQQPTMQSPSGLPIPQQQPAVATSSVLQNYKPVTAERLKKPEDGDWLMVRRTYDGWGYSPLDQITTANVKRLQPVWLLSTGVNNGHQAPPFVNNGVMFVTTSFNQLIALDAKTGQEFWRYRSAYPEGARVSKPVNRGVGLYGDKVFFGLGEAVLLALDARTGKEVWRAKVEENKAGYYMTAAPLVVDGKVLVGISGGDGNTRGFVAAYDVDTGKEVWR
jgi:alcohol dehydrogenase (cytochrome c)